MKIKIRYSFVLYIIILHFFNLLSYFTIFFLFILIHELTHGFCGLIFGLKISNIEVSLNGLSIEFENFELSLNKKLILLLSGPIINMLISIFIYIIFKEKYLFIVITNLLLFIFNMIPIYPLDGGKILYEILLKYCDFSKVKRILMIMYQVFSILFLLLTSYIYINFYNIQILFLGIYILGFCKYNNIKNIIVI